MVGKYVGLTDSYLSVVKVCFISYFMFITRVAQCLIENLREYYYIYYVAINLVLKMRSLSYGHNFIIAFNSGFFLP